MRRRSTQLAASQTLERGELNMKAAFPTSFAAVYMGREREAGSFKDDEGVNVSYGEKYLFAFENSQGLTQTVSITDERLRKVGVEPADLEKLQRLQIVGDVVLSDRGGGYLVPTEIVFAG
jgi:hypothetical protein